MLLFLTTVVLLVLNSLVLLVNFLTANWIADWVYRLLVDFPIPTPPGYFIAFGIVDGLAFVAIAIFLRIWVLAAWSDPNREMPPWLPVLADKIRCSDSAWPAWILVPLSLGLAVNLPTAFGDATPALMWWLMFFLLLGLWGNYRRGPLPAHASEKPDSPATETISSSSSGARVVTSAKGFIEQLRESPIYQGQIRFDSSGSEAMTKAFLKSAKPHYAPSESVQQISGNPIIKETFRSLRGLKLDRLYAHQGRVLDMSNGREEDLPQFMVLSTPMGSGRSTAALLFAMKRTLMDHRSVLFVYPTRQLGEWHSRRLRQAMTSSEWNWALEYASLWDDSATLDSPTPDLLFTTLDHLHGTLLRDHGRWEGLYTQLGLVVIDDLERYSGIVGSNAAFVFRRLDRICRHYGAKVQFFGISQPLEDIGAFTELLLGKPIRSGRIITERGAPANRKVLVFWNPPLRAPEPQADSMPQFARRAGFIEEAQLLYTEAVKAGLAPVILTYGVPMIEADLQAVRQPLLQALGRTYDVRVGSSLVGLGREPHQHNAAIVTGIASSPGFLTQELQYLGVPDETKDALICILAPSDPLSQYAMRCPDEFLAASDVYPSLVATLENPHIRKKHILCAAAELPLSQAEAEQLFTADARRDLQELEEEGKLASSPSPQSATDGDEKEATFIFADQEHPPHSTVALDTVGLDVVEISRTEIQGLAAGTLDGSRAAQIGYLNAAVVLDGVRYRVTRPYGKGHAAIGITQDAKSRRTERTGQTRIKPAAKLNVLDRKIGGSNLIFRTGYGTVRVDEEITGWNEDDVQGWNEFGSTMWTQIDPPIKSRFETRGACLIFPEAARELATPRVLHTLVHLFRAFIPLKIQNPAEEIELCYDPEFADVKARLSPTVWIYDNVPGGVGLAESIIQKHLEFLLRTAYRALASCPCANGCSSCIRITACRSNPRNDPREFDKTGTMSLLGQILAIPAYEADLRDRESQNVDDPRLLIDIRQRLVADIFPNQLGLKIAKIADPRFMTEDEMNARPIDGLYVGVDNLVLVRPNPHARVVAIMAHEYAHNWQAENMNSLLRASEIPYDGRLFVEGFAMWVEYKALDSYGLYNEIHFSNLFQYTEYEAGFQVLRYLEKQKGVAGVMEFMCEGGLGYPGGLAQLYEDSGVKPTVVGLNTRLKNEGKVLSEDWIQSTQELLAKT